MMIEQQSMGLLALWLLHIKLDTPGALSAQHCNRSHTAGHEQQALLMNQDPTCNPGLCNIDIAYLQTPDVLFQQQLYQVAAEQVS